MPTATKKPSLRKLLPAERCMFCKEKTDVIRTCKECGQKNFRVCKKCVAMGAPPIHAPRRMARVKFEKTSHFLCYPMCVRKHAYYCEHCHDYFDKDSFHGIRRQEGNRQNGICNGCSKRYNHTVCASCHAYTSMDSQLADKQGYKCGGCFSRGNSFKGVEKKYKVIKKAASARTFGLELEINNVHRKDELSEVIGALNVEGVEFCVRGDGSVHNGFEIVSFPAERKLLSSATKEMCKIVRKYKHNYEGCGLHVHIADPSIPLHQIFKMWISTEMFMFSFLPYFRRRSVYGKAYHDCSENIFERAMRTSSDESCLGLAGNRYRSMNLMALAKHGTCEVRSHHATSDYRDIFHFLVYLDTIYKAASKYSDYSKDGEFYRTIHDLSIASHTSFSSWETLARMIHLPLPTTHYLRGRRDFYLTHKDITDRQIGVLGSYEIDNASPARTLQEIAARELERMNEREERRQRMGNRFHQLITYSSPSNPPATLADSPSTIVIPEGSVDMFNALMRVNGSGRVNTIDSNGNALSVTESMARFDETSAENTPF